MFVKLTGSGELIAASEAGFVEFEYGHIPETKSAPLGSLVFRVARVMNPDSFVAVYPGGNGCDLATQAVQRLENLGLRNVHCYEEGLEGWRSAGLPIVESNSPKVHARGPVRECRPVIVDTENAYGGAFREKILATEGAGG